MAAGANLRVESWLKTVIIVAGPALIGYKYPN
jgi:hypothetical protein